MLDVTRQLYNAMLQQRRDAYKRGFHPITSRQQYAELTALRSEDARVAAVFREFEDAALHRLELAFKAFFKRAKRGERAGYPRFKPASRWNQLSFPHGNRALKFMAEQKRVAVATVGAVRLRRGRVIPRFGRAWLTRRGDKWYACFEHEIPPVEIASEPSAIIAVDRGTHVVAATSDGRLFRKPPSLANAASRVRFHQLAVEGVTVRDTGGRAQNRNDRERVKALERLRTAYRRQARSRRDYLHKLSRNLVENAKALALERLPVRAMTRTARGTATKPGTNVLAKAALNRAVLDAGFGLLQRMITYKAEGAGKVVVVVGARFSSQTCSLCGHVSAKSRRRRRFVCVSCGFAAHADINAALVIRRRAQLALKSAP